jgi:hypothetical protein
MTRGSAVATGRRCVHSRHAKSKDSWFPHRHAGTVIQAFFRAIKPSEAASAAYLTSPGRVSVADFLAFRTFCSRLHDAVLGAIEARVSWPIRKAAAACSNRAHRSRHRQLSPLGGIPPRAQSPDNNKHSSGEAAP